MQNLIQEKPTHDEIARAAYQLWEQRGHPQNRDAEFWLEAERQILSSRQASREPLTALTPSPHALAIQVRPSQATAKSPASSRRPGKGRSETTDTSRNHATLSAAPKTKSAPAATARP